MAYMKLYNRNSKTGRALMRVLNDEINMEPYTGEPRDYTLIRWGDAGAVRYKPSRLLNSKQGVANASNKFRSLEMMYNAGVNVPPHSTNKRDLNGTILGRRNRHRGGTDIDVNGTGDFYTRYLPATNEYRVHVFNSRIIGVQEKVLQDGFTDNNDVKIRNHDMGYRFVLRNIDNTNATLKSISRNAVESLGLDFGAVDVILGDDGSYYVLEVNTAPGLEATMFNHYAQELIDFVNNEQEVDRNFWEEYNFAEEEVFEDDEDVEDGDTVEADESPNDTVEITRKEYDDLKDILDKVKNKLL